MFKLKVGGHKELQKYYPAIAMDFDKKEMLPKLSMHKAMLKGDMEMLIMYDDQTGMELGYACAVKSGLYGYVLLKYVGVLSWFRGQGLGVQFMRLINKHYMEKQGIMAEITVFDDEDDSTLKKLRKFFARFGYVKLKSDYRIGGSEVELMVKPIKGDGEVEKFEHRMIYDFYSRLLSPSAMSEMIEISPAD